MNIFNKDMDVYGYKLQYDEAVAMGNVTYWSYIYSTDLDFEDLVIIAEAVYFFWNNIKYLFAMNDETCKKYPWLYPQSAEEEQYISAYSYRMAPNIIELYMKENKE